MLKNQIFTFVCFIALCTSFCWRAFAWSGQLLPLKEKATHTLEQSTISEQLKDRKIKSTQGREFNIIRFKPKNVVTHKVLIQSGLHGNEKGPVLFTHWLIHRIKQGVSPLIKINGFSSTQFDFLPVSNPDGMNANNRYNARGVNLNRNFGVLWGLSRENPGKKAFSEPETIAIKGLMEKENYEFAIDVHGYVNWLIGPSSSKQISKKVETQRKHVDIYERWMGLLRRSLRHLKKAALPYKFMTAAELGDGGAFEDWAFWESKSLSFCLEMKSPLRYMANKDGNTLDQYKVYENYLYEVLKDAMDHPQLNRSKQKILMKDKLKSKP